MHGLKLKVNPYSRARRLSTSSRTAFPQTNVSIPNSQQSRSSNNSSCDVVQQKRRGREGPLPFLYAWRGSLRQRFDVEIELEASRLLNAEQEAHVNGGAICDRCRQCDYTRRQRGI